jgi:exonuclease SbcC
MRPLRLDMAGFTVFRDETTVDFTDADYFALVGPTGSGKSTVLDAICFALYGTVPRWGGSRGIVNALSPSTNEARVRLVFESAGDRYVATRVVRRDGRGNVKTSGAGLQLMPPGFDPERLDTGMSLDDLGEVLAGTPAEMDRAIIDAVGLPYEQFTSCVILPQGQFADFLHAKPAVRQQILINLLGLHVYESVQKEASARAGTAEGKLAAVDQVLETLADADDEAVAAAEAQVTRMRELTAAVEEAVPRLRTALSTETTAAQIRDSLDAELKVLASVKAPTRSGRAADAVAAARATAAQAADAVRLAEEREEKVRGELTTAGDPSTLRMLLDRHAEQTRLVDQVDFLAGDVRVAQMEHSDAVAGAELARAAHTGAEQLLEQARRDYADAQTADRAAALRVHLRPGDGCPVCEQTVAVVPPVPQGSAVHAAEASGKAARAAAEVAASAFQQRDAVARELDRGLERKRAQHEHLAARLAEVTAGLADSPGEQALHRRLSELTALQRRLDDAGAGVRAARDALHKAQAAVGAADDAVRAAWRTFDTGRDAVARFGPPPADRDDLAAAWTTLVSWADAERRRREQALADAVTAVESAHTATAHERATIGTLFTDAGLAPPSAATTSGRAEGDAIRPAAVAAERAEAAWQRLVDRRAQAAQLGEQRALHEQEGRVAKALAGHLRANNFERWLLEEALDVLVDGASRILRELTGGQYDLMHDKGEFSVIDHHDAGLRRGVRTLSGGETFQASLALALALSEQLAGMSTTAASLESIVLDEGFGTLDAATLDVVAATLENLAARGDRMVGVVTHVNALAERVPVRFEVRKDARSARVERTGL